jgi:hypothetical protein
MSVTGQRNQALRQSCMRNGPAARQTHHVLVVQMARYSSNTGVVRFLASNFVQYHLFPPSHEISASMLLKYRYFGVFTVFFFVPFRPEILPWES